MVFYIDECEKTCYSEAVHVQNGTAHAGNLQYKSFHFQHPSMRGNIGSLRGKLLCSESSYAYVHVAR